MQHTVYFHLNILTEKAFIVIIEAASDVDKCLVLLHNKVP